MNLPSSLSNPFSSDSDDDGNSQGSSGPAFGVIKHEPETEEGEVEYEIDISDEEFTQILSHASDVAEDYSERIEKHTVDILEDEDFDEEEFFTNEDGTPTIVNRFDLEMAVSADQKTHLQEIDRYWVNKPYAFISIFRSRRENEVKYFVIEPHLTEAEFELIDFLEEKLRVELKYDTDEIQSDATDEEMEETINENTMELLQTYGLYEKQESGFATRIKALLNRAGSSEDDDEDEGVNTNARPVDAIEKDIERQVNEHQVEKILYFLRRNFVGNQKIDPITKDLSVEDISCDGYNSPVFVYHGDHEQIISNVEHGKESLDNFVTQLAQRSGKGISKRKPQVDATLPNGSRAQLTLGDEVSDHGTNYTIRQFKEVPFTPIDLINWNTFSLEQMAFFWLAIENHKNLIFAGGTASGKTTSLNAVSLFIPSSAKIVSIEDTREVELPQRNWIASVTRPSFTGDAEGDVDEFDLLEAALRQRPDYIVMGEIRGEEGRTLFQVMSTGHTTYTTFHADSVSEVIKRFTTDPINVSKTMFTALDLVSIQTQTIVDSNKVRRNKVLTEINNYDTDSDEINVQDVYEWQAETDQFLKMGESNVIQDIKFERGWDEKQVEDELGKRRLVLAYMMKEGLNEYVQVASTLQAFINDPETVLTLIANDRLEHSLSALQQMDSILLDVTDEAEERAGRPTPDEEMMQKCNDVLDEYSYILEEYEGESANIEAALEPSDPTPDPDSDLSENITVVSDDEELEGEELMEVVEEDVPTSLDDLTEDEIDSLDETERQEIEDRDDTTNSSPPELEAAETEPDNSVEDNSVDEESDEESDEDEENEPNWETADGATEEDDEDTSDDDEDEPSFTPINEIDDDENAEDEKEDTDDSASSSDSETTDDTDDTIFGDE